jgi:hypothetical protein
VSLPILQYAGTYVGSDDSNHTMVDLNAVTEMRGGCSHVGNSASQAVAGLEVHSENFNNGIMQTLKSNQTIRIPLCRIGRLQFSSTNCKTVIGMSVDQPLKH